MRNISKDRKWMLSPDKRGNRPAFKRMLSPPSTLWIVISICIHFSILLLLSTQLPGQRKPAYGVPSMYMSAKN